MSRFAIDPPASKDEIAAALGRLEGEITAYLGEIPVDEFLAPQGDAWSPERHLRHLAKSVRAVAGGMRIARILLRIRVGVAKEPSRSFDEVVAVYRAALAEGATAGRFTPSELPAAVTPEEWRDQVIERWRQASTALAASMGRWSEKALDRYRLPHPLLGKMTVREILFFTVYHNAHHVRRIEERRGSVQ